MGEGKEGNACSQVSVGQRTELVIGWAGRTLLTCVNQRSLKNSEACLQEALTFHTERVFSREQGAYM